MGDQGAYVAGSLVRVHCQVLDFTVLHMGEGAMALCGVPFIRTLIPFLKVPFP